MDRLILITGGSGYVGSVLTPLVAKEYPVRVLETMTFGNPIVDVPNVDFIQGDIRDEDKVREAMIGVTDIIHLAGIVTDELVDMNPDLALAINTTAMEDICCAARDASVQRFIYASSSSVYGTQNLVCTEESETMPMSAYASSKLEGEVILNKFKDDMTIVSVRSATACGPSPRIRFDTIVNVFCKQAYFDKKITVYGGTQYRSNIHVKDVSELYRFLLDVRSDIIHDEVFNAVRHYNTALELADLVQSIIPCEIFVDKTKIDNRHYRMNGDKIYLKTGWFPTTRIETAIQDNLQTFVSGEIKDPESDLYVNTRRMADFMKGAANAS
jgi:nucleoside-diphosphate-sugar epimerase